MQHILSIALLLGISGIVLAGDKAFHNKLNRSVVVEVMSEFGQTKNRKIARKVASRATIHSNGYGYISYEGYKAASVMVFVQRGRKKKETLLAKLDAQDVLNAHTYFEIVDTTGKVAIVPASPEGFKKIQ